MNVLLSWLRDFAPVDAPPDVVARALDDLGTPVESMEVVGEGFEEVVVARVVALRPHSDADRVQLVDVEVGGDTRQVVCGAFNMREGDLVPLATVGARLPNGMEIARRKVRGQWSDGMLCAPDELGLPGGHDGILVLPPGLTTGTSVGDALGIGPDVLFELEVNANRPDALSVVGVARDLAARLRIPFRLPEPAVSESAPPTQELASVEIEAPDLCGRFLARVLQDVHVGPSPAWMASRLALSGMRPINNVVDASNYVMLELGQPNHPYDLSLLKGRGLRVRRARPEECMVTLDDVERRLITEDLLICDATDVPVGIAGVMGGAGSEIRPGTTEVLLEAAWFQPMAVARTSKRLGLRTEASARFERGCDPDIVPLAASRFCELVAESGGAAVARGAVDVVGELPPSAPVRVRTSRVNRVLGTELSDAEIRGYLEPIGFATLAERAGDLDVGVPSWRPDTSTEIDVIEEVARHHGYSNIAPTMPSSARAGGLTRRQRDRRLVRQVLAGAGASEAWCTTFLAPSDLERAGLSTDAIRLANPLVAEESLLRTSLLPGLLKAVSYNVAHRNPGVALFEIGHVFLPPGDGARLPDELEAVAVAMHGCDAPEAVDVWRVLAEGIGLQDWELVAGGSPGLHPTRTARVQTGGRAIGVVGEVDPAVVAAFELEDRVAWFEIDLGLLLDAPHGSAVYRPVSRFPSSDIDLAFIVDERTPAAAVARSIETAAGDLLVSVELFDVYRGDPVPAGQRSLAFRLRLQAQDRTLTDEEVAVLRQRCIERVETDHGATLRH